MDQAVRRQRLTSLLTAADVDGLLVTRPVNVRYLCGFTGSNGALLVTADSTWLATDGRYRTQAGEQSPDVELIIDRDVAPALARLAGGRRVRRLGFEAHDVTVAAYDVLVDAAHPCALVRAGQPVEKLRAIKDPDEVALIREACRITDAAFDHVLQTIHAGQSERAIARSLEERMRDLGADGPAFDSIVAAGPNSAVPHHEPTERELQPGDLVKCDFGALREGYHSDMTRTLVVGKPADWQLEIHALVAAAQRSGCDALVPGADCREVDGAARAVISATQYADAFVHGLGHGVGLEIHEAPSLGSKATGSLAAQMVVTVEPGVYLPGRGGVRIEDTLVVGTDTAEPLTRSPHELLSV